MRCLVTGASGFVGSHLVRQLLTRGHSVTVLLRPGSDYSRIADCLHSVQVVYGALDNTSALGEALAREAVEAVFHLAWFGVTAEYRNSFEQITKNVEGALELWKLSQKYGVRVWIGLGSQAEYGPHSGVLKEELPTRPATAYGVAKLATGMLTAELCAIQNMRHVWLRLLSAYGPADDDHHMIPSVIRLLLRREKPSLTAGEQVWDYLYVSDAAEALCAVLESEACGVFNLSSGMAYPLRQIVESLRDCVDPQLPIGFGDIEYRHDQVMHLEGDISRLKSATGWGPRVSLKEGLHRTVEWYRQSFASIKNQDIL